MDLLEFLVLGLTWAWFLGTGLVLTKWDVRERRLPNRFVALALVGGLIGFSILSAVEQSWISLARGAMGAGLCVLAFSLIHILGGMGMGDVKYSAVIGLYLGWLSWESIYWGVFIAFALAACAVAVSVVRRKPQRTIAFGPFMTLGTVVTAAIFSW